MKSKKKTTTVHLAPCLVTLTGDDLVEAGRAGVRVSNPLKADLSPGTLHMCQCGIRGLKVVVSQGRQKP